MSRLYVWKRGTQGTPRDALSTLQHEGDGILKIRYHRHMTIEPVVSADPCSRLDPAAALFHSLSDPTRLSIVKRMAGGEVRVGDLTTELGLAQSTVSAHVACLRDCGLVEGRVQGRSVYYSLSRPELMDVLAQAEILLAATGNAVSLCPNYGTGSTGVPLMKEYER